MTTIEVVFQFISFFYNCLHLMFFLLNLQMNIFFRSDKGKEKYCFSSNFSQCNFHLSKKREKSKHTKYSNLSHCTVACIYNICLPVNIKHPNMLTIEQLSIKSTTNSVRATDTFLKAIRKTLLQCIQIYHGNITSSSNFCTTCVGL